MIIVLKIILGLMALANIFVFRYISKDFIKIRKTEGFDNLSIFERLRLSVVFYFLLMALLSLFSFFIYFIIIPIQIV